MSGPHEVRVGPIACQDHVTVHVLVGDALGCFQTAEVHRAFDTGAKDGAGALANTEERRHQAIQRQDGSVESISIPQGSPSEALG